MKHSLFGIVGLMLGVLVIGCDKPAGSASQASSAPTPSAKKVDDHSGWWCDEHGMPEEVCDLCSKKYREAEKAKGNWCEHDRVKSSCFKCNPAAKEKWAKEYEARYGKKPPEPEADEKEAPKK